MKAIVVKYIGPSSTKPSRLKATAEGGHSLTTSFDHSDSDPYKALALQLAIKLDWRGTYHGGTLPTGERVYVCQSDDSFTSVVSDKETHWSYGSGSAGCLYDSGPSFAETKEAAIEGALCIFQDLSKAELARARKNLSKSHIHYFGGRAREVAGADYVEVDMHTGPCPDSEV